MTPQWRTLPAGPTRAAVDAVAAVTAVTAVAVPQPAVAAGAAGPAVAGRHPRGIEHGVPARTALATVADQSGITAPAAR